MKKPASLNRLRDISKQRSIRRPLADADSPDDPQDPKVSAPNVIEWPIGR